MLQIKRFIVSALIFILPAGLPVQAQSLRTEHEKPSRPSDLTVESQARFRHFQQSDAKQKFELLQQAREQLADFQMRETEVSNEREILATQVGSTNEELIAEAKLIGEMLGRFRWEAENVENKLHLSLASFEYTGRTEALHKIATSRKLPTMGDLNLLPNTIIQEMHAQSEVKRFTAEVVHASTDGRTQQTELVRVGGFQAITVDGLEFVTMQRINTNEGKSIKLFTFPGQPRIGTRAAMSALIAAGEKDIIRVPIDPTHGKLLTAGIRDQR